ncbi:MAG: GtrA family protein [Oscillospiraceae bacterium]|jgi:putative flippase GtrA|nr:GtrA family protein [Oscillospiraceae bacterium]
MKEKLRMLFDEKMWKFLLVGAANTLVGTGLGLTLLNLLDWSVSVSSGVSTILASVMSYFLNRHFTFKYKGDTWKPMLRFALNIAVCWLLAYELPPRLFNRLLAGVSEDTRKNIVMLIGAGLFVGLNYFGQRFFAFREKKE